jgi:hypothetical protein
LLSDNPTHLDVISSLSRVAHLQCRFETAALL